jgi:tetratricopeptide (TPR) repeat protein
MQKEESLSLFKDALEAHKEGRLDEAKSLYIELLSSNPKEIRALINLARIYRAKGSFSLAIGSLREALEIDPKSVEALVALATVYADIGEFHKGAKLLNQAIKIAPNSAALFNEVGIFFEKARDYEKALNFYKEAIRRDEKFTKAYNNIGVILYKQKRFKEAVEIFELSLRANDRVVSTYVNLGAACNKAKLYQRGIKALLKAIELDPANSGAYGNLGNIYNKIKEHKEALKMHKKALELDDKSASNHANIGITYKNLREYKSAKSALKQAIKIDPDFVNAHFDLSTTYLTLGEYKRGFEEYEWRFKKEEMRGLLYDLKEIIKKPRLKIEEIKEDGTLLLYTEQGYGDILQFLRFAKLLKKRYEKLTITLQVREGLKELVKEVDYIDRVVERGEDVGEFDYQCALMSLPYILKISKSKIPYKKGYIEFKEKERDIVKSDGKKSIGIVWGASKTGESYEDKVFSLRYFKPLTQEDRICLYSLQVGEDANEIRELGLSEEIIDLEEKLTDFRVSAKVVNSLDLVITSDTSVAHLCGALGKEVWVVLQKNADWRWDMRGDKSSWYESARLFRQDTQGDWDSAFKKVYRALNDRYDLDLKEVI